MTPPLDDDTQPLEPGEQGWPVRAEATGPEPSAHGAPPATGAAPPAPRFRHLARAPWALVALAALALAAAGAALAVVEFWGNPTEPATVAAASAGGASSGKVKRRQAKEPTKTKDRAGAQARRVSVPELIGWSRDKAFAELESLGFEVRTVAVASREAKGRVLRQTPAGGKVEKGSSVTLYVSDATQAPPPEVTVPDVTGSALAGASAEVRGQGLVVNTEQVPSDLARGTVVSQWPRAGAQLPKGGSVLLNVSRGRPAPTLVLVPLVTGNAEDVARSRLASAGFHVSVATTPTDNLGKDGTVFSQSPAGGTKAAPGSTVTITVGRYS